MAVSSGSCIDCGTLVPTVRCAPCQRRHNDRLRAEHELTVRAMFRAAESRGGGRSAKTGGRRRKSASASSDTATI
jgi:hypothetical protein